MVKRGNRKKREMGKGNWERFLLTLLPSSPVPLFGSLNLLLCAFRFYLAAWRESSFAGSFAQSRKDQIKRRQARLKIKTLPPFSLIHFVSLAHAMIPDRKFNPT
jgi:hypothetical protein